MDEFFERLIARATTLDELLSADFVPLTGQNRDTDLAARRLAAWCRSCASGDWLLLSRRLERDGLTFANVLSRFATVERSASARMPTWIDDSVWIEAALRAPPFDSAAMTSVSGPVAFEHLFVQLVTQAETRVLRHIGERYFSHLNERARADLRYMLLKQLSDLFSPSLYDMFDDARHGISDFDTLTAIYSTSVYKEFVDNMTQGRGFRPLFETKPVLLRLTAIVVRQWIDSTSEFLLRLDADILVIRESLFNLAACKIEHIEGDLSDPHNNGRTVKVISFEDGRRVVYKPKDLRLDAAWYVFVSKLNSSDTPIQLKTPLTLARVGYGWSEFIDHSSCVDDNGHRTFFRRAGAWLALFHLFLGSDMHEENIIAAGEHPVPIDLEMLLQPTALEHQTDVPEARAFEAAMEIIDNSVMTVGLLPVHVHSTGKGVVATGGMTSDWKSGIKISWESINSDTMRPTENRELNTCIPNLPHINGVYAQFYDYVSDFVDGFQAYAAFMVSQARLPNWIDLFGTFSALPIRKIIRSTSFYYLLLQRLKDHNAMFDGVIWSAQADFLARLTDWDSDNDPIWDLQKAERATLTALNVPHFTSLSDSNKIHDSDGCSVEVAATSGFTRARDRIRNFSEVDIALQADMIRQNTATGVKSQRIAPATATRSQVFSAAKEGMRNVEVWRREADKIAADIAFYSIRRGPVAAWIGLDWLGDTDVAQLAPLGADLYNGISGIAVFLAAHAKVTGSKTSSDLAVAAIAHLRKNIRGRNAARIARSLGTGAATGLGSVVYAFALIAECLRDDTILGDAHAAAELFSDDLIAADEQFDIGGGNAGGILSLLRLHRDSRSAKTLELAVKCGANLLKQSCDIGDGLVWLRQDGGQRALNGILHGSVGVAYAMASLADVTKQDEFTRATLRYMEFIDNNNETIHNDLSISDEGSLSLSHKWRQGIRQARNARMAGKSGFASAILANHFGYALPNADGDWLGDVDTLCGALGNIELFREAAVMLNQDHFRDLAAQGLMVVIHDADSSGDYRWEVGERRFNVGLFRGLAGVGYTLLRQIDNALPNVLIWQ